MIRLVKSEISAFIDGGNRDVQVNTEFSLDGSFSHNPDNVPGEFVWSCAVHDGKFFIQGCPFDIPSTEERVSLSAGVVGLYSIKLTIVPHDRQYQSSEFTVLINVKENAITPVIQSKPPGLTTFNPDDKITFTVTPLSTNASSWTLKDRNSNVIDLSAISIYQEGNTLILKSGVLVPGTSYNLIYEVIGSAVQGRSEYAFSIYVRPYIDCVLDPTSGVFVLTKFDILCAGEDIEQYHISLSNPPAKDIHLSHQRKPDISVLLQPLSEETKQFSFVITGQDRNGVESEEIRIGFEASPSDKVKLPDVIHDLLLFIDINIRIRHYSSALSEIVMLASVIPLYQDSDMDEIIREKLLEFITSISEYIDKDPLTVSEALYYIFETGKTCENEIKIGLDVIEDLLTNVKESQSVEENILRDILNSTVRTLSNIVSKSEINYLKFSYQILEIIEHISDIQLGFLQPAEDKEYINDYVALRYYMIPSQRLSTHYQILDTSDRVIVEFPILEVNDPAQLIPTLIGKYETNFLDTTNTSTIIEIRLKAEDIYKSSQGELMIIMSSLVKKRDLVDHSSSFCHSWDFDELRWRADCNTIKNGEEIICECEDINGYYTLIDLPITTKVWDNNLLVTGVLLVTFSVGSIIIVIIFLLRRKPNKVVWDKDIQMEEMENSIGLTSDEFSTLSKTGDSLSFDLTSSE